MTYVKLISIAALLHLLIFYVTAQIVIPVNEKVTVSIDGLQTEQEWRDASRFELTGDFTICLMSDSKWIYIGVFREGQATHFTDLYIQTKERLNLHASMQLGERVLPADGYWDDDRPAFSWANTMNWTANVVTYKPGTLESSSFDKQVVFYEGQEFKIDKSKILNQFKLLIRLRDFVNASVDLVYPSQGNLQNTHTWQSIQLNN